MTFHGHVEKGQIILDEPADLPERTRVSVEPIRQNTSVQLGAATTILSAIEPWQGPPEELDLLMAEVQQIRDGDLLPRRDDLG